uniref:Anaphase-promoting complex subunit 4 WD40 domain-containing protein n=1 Tax=Leersia perrieri TaxID=77586 RepID=A0A0D9X102_9ORYZ
MNQASLSSSFSSTIPRIAASPCPAKSPPVEISNTILLLFLLRSLLPRDLAFESHPSLAKSIVAAAMSTAPTGDPPSLVPGAGGGGMGLGKELRDPPSDGVSSIRFSKHSDRLLVSSWDKTVRLYDPEANAPRWVFMHAAPVLDCCFHDDFSGFSASGDNTVRRLAYSTGGNDILGRHDAPARCVEYSYSTGQVITGSWDKTIKCWDPRGVSGTSYHTLVGTQNQPERVYSLSLSGYNLVVATAGRHVNVYDLRSMSRPEQQRESPLKFQTRCVQCYPNGIGFALASVEGRVAMEFFDQSEYASSKKYGTFATGGCDGFVSFWDGDNKRKLFQVPRYPSSISALSFSRDGRLLAVASSYTFEEGDKPHPPDAIFIRDVNEGEVKPRPKITFIAPPSVATPSV